MTTHITYYYIIIIDVYNTLHMLGLITAKLILLYCVL